MNALAWLPTAEDEEVEPNLVAPIEGMTCASCVGRVERAIRQVPGVLDVSVNLATERAEVTFEDRPRNAGAAADAIFKAGFLRRPGGQTQFSASLAAQAMTGGRLDELLVWMADNPDADLSLPALADRAAMSERNFGRVFARQAGMTPASYVECIRLDRAKLYLETTDWPLARVADRSGLGSVATLIRAFAKRLSITPDAYRKRFGTRANTMA